MFVVMTLDHSGEGRKGFGEIRVRGLFDSPCGKVSVQETDFVVVQLFAVFLVYLLADISQIRCPLGGGGSSDSGKIPVGKMLVATKPEMVPMRPTGRGISSRFMSRSAGLASNGL